MADLCVNDLRVKGFSCVKYADDTTFYTNVLDDSFSDMISSAVEATNLWASANNTLLNTDKTVLVNSTTNTIKEILVNGTKIMPSDHMKLLRCGYTGRRLASPTTVAAKSPDA